MSRQNVSVELSEEPSLRLSYVLNFVFGQVLDADFHFVRDSSSADIVYRKDGLQSESVNQIYYSGWLEEMMPGKITPWGNPSRGELRSGADHYSLKLDVFADIFFHLSRIEEYNAPRDDLGRFESQSSFLGRNSLLHKPLVDYHIAELIKALEKKGKSLEYNQSYQYLPTYDVDFAWYIKNRKPKAQLRTVMGRLLRAKWGILKDLLWTKLGVQKDPYDHWSEIVDIHKKTGLETLFFILLSKQGKLDPDVNFTSPAFLSLLERLKQVGKLAWHPGYESNSSAKLFETEINNYTQLTGALPMASRQHFLVLDIPQTYQRLESNGVKTDYTMGYADQVGFRAGTSHAFFWYDLLNEKQSNLLVQPFAFMDVSFKNYMKSGHLEALNQMIKLESEVKKFSGTLVSIWHNSSFYDREGWKELKKAYLEFINRYFHA